ncbi:MAG: V-type ATP synthase subunit F [archaeon]
MNDDKKSSIAVIADGPTCMGFRLAGIEKVYPVEEKQAEQKIEQLLENKEIGILIINEKSLEELGWLMKKKLDRLAKPVIITVPGKEGAIEQKGDSLKAMVKKALGFDIM